MWDVVGLADLTPAYSSTFDDVNETFQTPRVGLEPTTWRLQLPSGFPEDRTILSPYHEHYTVHSAGAGRWLKLIGTGRLTS